MNSQPPDPCFLRRKSGGENGLLSCRVGALLGKELQALRGLQRLHARNGVFGIFPPVFAALDGN